MSHSAPPREAVSVLSQDFLVDVPCSLAVNVPGAHLRLRPGTTPEQVEVEISVTGSAPSEERTILRHMELGARKTKNIVSVYSDSDRAGMDWWRWVRTFDAEIHVDLRVPPRVEADIRAPGGAVDLADLQGYFDIKVMGGPCEVNAVEGTLDIRAESSEVSIRDFSGKQLLTRVAVGKLTLENVEANTITTRSVAAPMTLTSVTGATRVIAKGAPVDLQSVPGPCVARAEGGSLTYDGRPTDAIELQGIGTALDARLPATHGATLQMTGPNLTLADAFAFEGERTDEEIEGTLNGGGPPLSLTTTGGSIHCQPS